MTRTDYIDSDQAAHRLVSGLNEAIAQQLKTLLETKNLYQSVAIEFTSIYSELHARALIAGAQSHFQKFADEISETNLKPSDRELFTIRRLDNFPVPTLLVQNAKLFCSNCGQRETFSPTGYADTTQPLVGRHTSEPRIALPPRRFQLFTLTYQCEACRGVPVGFLIKFHDWKLTIEGRSPFGEVEVPNFIPKLERKLFSNAIVAAETGHELAGVFYLRCFIEQFARRQTGIKDKRPGEEILESYQSKLPVSQRHQMPSLRSWYEKLSEAIHAAKADAALFQDARAGIVEHFDFRRLFKIPEVRDAEAPAGSKEKSGTAESAGD